MDIITISVEMDNEKKRLREVEKDEVTLGMEMVTAEAEYEKALARVLLSIDGAANKAERLARGETADLRFKWKAAEVVYKANIRAQSNCQAIINMLQSKLKYME